MALNIAQRSGILAVAGVAVLGLSGCFMQPATPDPEPTTAPPATESSEPTTSSEPTETNQPSSESITVSVQGYTWELTPTGSLSGEEAAAAVGSDAPSGEEFYILEMDVNQTAGDDETVIAAADISLIGSDGTPYSVSTALAYTAPNDIFFVEGSGTGAQALVVAPEGETGTEWQIDTVDGQTFTINL